MGQYEERHKILLARIEGLFTQRKPFLGLCQEIAENFYPERADFTYQRRLGVDFADNLTTSKPILIRRDLANQVSAMLRPPGQTYAHLTTDRPENNLDNASLRWLEDKTAVQFRAMKDPVARFTRATKETDHDFVTFGQGVLSAELNMRTTSLLYRSWHLRDVVWADKSDGSIGIRARDWRACAKDLCDLFQGNVHAQVDKCVNSNGGKDAYKKFKIYHVIVPADEYDYTNPASNRQSEWVSLYIDVENKFVMEERYSLTPYYIIPRWQTVSGSQYAYSPATVAALPDARLLQAITFTLLKAGEKAVDPMMIAVEEMVKSPIDYRPGGVTWVDADYDERLGEVLRPISTDGRGIPVGLNMQDRLEATLHQAFYLDKLALPQFGPEMTAYEVSQRLQEYIRQAIPLFEPIEEEYNAQVFNQTFDLLMAVNTFGSRDDIPEMLQGRAVKFRFESPLIEASDQKLVQTFNVTAQLIAAAAQLDPIAGQLVDVPVALRQALRGGQVPATWVKDEDTMAQIAEQEKQKQAAMQQAAILQQAGAAGEAIGNAGLAVNQAVQGATRG
jgi:hypothetical protein